MQPVEPTGLNQAVLTVAECVVLFPLLVSGALAIWRAIHECMARPETDPNPLRSSQWLKPLL